jgi:hypothetical protein
MEGKGNRGHYLGWSFGCEWHGVNIRGTIDIFFDNLNMMIEALCGERK